MIKLTSFFPFNYFLSVTQEFRKDKVIVRSKSLTFEREFEFNYKDIGEIADSYQSDGNQNSFGFWMICVVSIAIAVFCITISLSGALLRIMQALYILGILIYLTSFKKSWCIHFSDKNDNFVTSIKQDRKNRDQIRQAIELLKHKSAKIKVLSAAGPFPQTKHIFEHIEYDISKLKKTTDRFYQNEIIGFQKGIFGETLYRVDYSQLSGKIYHSRVDNDIWGWVFTFDTLITSILAGLYFGFGVGNAKALLWIIGTGAVVTLISWLFKFVKRDVVGLVHKHGHAAYWTHTNQSNKENVEKAIKYVQSRISKKAKKQ